MKSKRPPPPAETEPPNLRDRVAALKNQVLALRGELATERDERAAEAEVTGKLMARVAELEAGTRPPTRKKRESRNLDAEAQAAKAIGELRASLAEAQDREQVAETRLRAEQEAATLLHEKLKAARTQLDEASRAAVARDRAMEDIRAENEGLRAQAETLETTLAEHTASHASALALLQRSSEVIQAAAVDLGRERDEALLRADALEREIEASRRELGGDRDAFEQAAADAIRERDEVRALLASREQSLAAVQQELENDRHALQDAELGLARDRERVKNLHARVVELGGELAAVGEARDRANRELQVVRAEVERVRAEGAAALQATARQVEAERVATAEMQRAAAQEIERAADLEDRLGALARKHESVEQACAALTSELERERLATQDAQLALACKREEVDATRSRMADVEKKAATREKTHIDAIVRLRQEHEHATASVAQRYEARLRTSDEAMQESHAAQLKAESALAVARGEVEAARADATAAIATVVAIQGRVQETLEGVVGLSDTLEEVARREREVAQARTRSVTMARILLDQVVALENTASGGVELVQDAATSESPSEIVDADVLDEPAITFERG